MRRRVDRILHVEAFEKAKQAAEEALREEFTMKPCASTGETDSKHAIDAVASTDSETGPVIKNHDIGNNQSDGHGETSHSCKNKSKVTCYRCKNVGHFADKCPDKKVRQTKG